MDRHPLRLARPGWAGGQELAELTRHRDRPAFPIDADEDELRRGNEGVVPHPTGGLPHGEAGAAMMGEGLVEAEDIAGERRRMIVDHRFPHRGPGAGAGEDIHAGSLDQHLPPGALEETEKRGLVEMTEGVAFVRIDGEVDIGMGHGGGALRVGHRCVGPTGPNRAK